MSDNNKLTVFVVAAAAIVCIIHHGSKIRRFFMNTGILFVELAYVCNIYT